MFPRPRPYITLISVLGTAMLVSSLGLLAAAPTLIDQNKHPSAYDDFVHRMLLLLTISFVVVLLGALAMFVRELADLRALRQSIDIKPQLVPQDRIATPNGIWCHVVWRIFLRVDYVGPFASFVARGGGIQGTPASWNDPDPYEVDAFSWEHPLDKRCDMEGGGQARIKICEISDGANVTSPSGQIADTKRAFWFMLPSSATYSAGGHNFGLQLIEGWPKPSGGVEEWPLVIEFDLELSSNMSHKPWRYHVVIHLPQNAEDEPKLKLTELKVKT